MCLKFWEFLSEDVQSEKDSRYLLNLYIFHTLFILIFGTVTRNRGLLTPTEDYNNGNFVQPEAGKMCVYKLRYDRAAGGKQTKTVTVCNSTFVYIVATSRSFQTEGAYV